MESNFGQADLIRHLIVHDFCVYINPTWRDLFLFRHYPMQKLIGCWIFKIRQKLCVILEKCKKLSIKYEV